MTYSRSLIFILTDQQRSDTLACYGNDVIRTPHLNGLAERSVVFQRAYCAQPECSPSRATLLTGLWPHTHGCIKNNMPLPADIPTLPELVPPEYRRAYYGKWHLGDELVPKRGIEDWVSIEDGQYRKHFSSHDHLELRSDYHHFLVRNGFVPDAQARDGARVFSRWFAAGLAERFTKAAFLGREAARFLHENVGRDPFIMVVSFLEPHPPFFGPLNDLHDPASIATGDAFLESPCADVAKRNRRWARRFENGFKSYRLASEWDWRRLRANYFGLVALVDRAIGTILDALESCGRADDTLVVFTSDHGEMLGDHGMLTKGVMYEESTRVPWLLSAPWLASKVRTIEQPVSHIDLVPTVLELLGLEVPAHLQGDSMAPALTGLAEAGDAAVGSAEAGEEAVVVEWHRQRNLRGDARSAVSRDGWKLNAYTNDRWELFDLSSDPFERINLFGRDDQHARVQRMYAALRHWQASVADPVHLPKPAGSGGLLSSLRNAVGRP